MAEESPWRTALRDNQEFLEETLVFRDIRAMLLQERVISDRDSARIIQKGNSYDQIAKLVEVMRTKDAKAYCSFLESLKGLAGQGHIYKSLNGGCSAQKAKEWEKKQDYSDSPEETPESQPVTATQNKSRLEEMTSLLINKKISLEDLVMQKASEQLIKSVGKNDCYGIKSGTRGRALIISNVKFEDLEVIETNNYDAQLVQTVLDDLHFDTRIKWNKTAKEIHEILHKERRSQPSMPDAFVLVVLSHGGQRFIYGTDGKKIYLETEGDNPGIYSYFYNDNCGALDGKPKMFFIQACQSENRPVQVAPADDTEDVRSTAVPVNPTQENVTAVPVNPTEEDGTAVPVNTTEEDGTAVPVNTTHEDGTAVPVNPTLEDVSAVSANATPDAAVLSPHKSNPNKQAHMVKVISTCPGDKAFADKELGGWFIRALVIVLKKCAHDTDIQDMCNIIQEILGKLRNEDDDSQLAPYTHTLGIRKFYFLPGYKGQKTQKQKQPTDN